MPHIDAAAIASIFRITGLRPRMSVTENIIVMSFMPTQCATFPEAIVDTITLGKPYGKARMTLVASVVPCVPPIDIIPLTFPWVTRSITRWVVPSAIIGAATSLVGFSSNVFKEVPPA